MPRTLWRLLAALLVAALGAAACSDSPTGGTPPVAEEAELGFSLNLSGTTVNALVVEVTASDITGRLVFNIPVTNGTASGSVTVPAGSARTVTVKAYDSRGTLTHQGSKTVDVKAGNNPPVTIPLTPQAGDLPITISFGSLVVTVTRVTAAPFGGNDPADTVRFRAAVKQADGTAVAGATVRWASLNPAIATVDSTGLVTTRTAGSTEIVATYAGYGAAALITVKGDGTNGTADKTAPRLTSFSLSPDSLVITPTDTVIRVSLQATDLGAGVSGIQMEIRGPGDASLRFCNNTLPNPAAGGDAPVTLTCTFELSRYSPGGTWTMAMVSVGDKAGNWRYYGDTDLAAGGFERTIRVVNANGDGTAPTVSGVFFGQDTVSLANGGEYVTISARVGDVGSGVASVELNAYGGNPNEGTRSFTCYATRTPDPAVWSCSQYLDSQMPAGDYRVSRVTVRDHADNYTELFDYQLAQMGIYTQLVITR
jgi:hypothetical protein